MEKRKVTRFENQPNKNTLILDGKAIAYRALYSGGATLSKDNIRTGVYYQFFKSLYYLARKFKPFNTVIMWDSKSENSVRKKTFSGYKNRNNFSKLSLEQQDNLKLFGKEYLKIIKLCDQLGFASYYMEGYEADDLIALWAKLYNHTKCIMVTHDEDMYQCIRKNVIFYDINKGQLKTTTWFRNKYGIVPEQWAEYKSLAGCKSDTVPGIDGVGEKTALKYLRGEPLTKRYETMLENGKEEKDFFYDIVVLPHPDLKDYRLRYKMTKFDLEKFEEVCSKFGFNSLLGKLNIFRHFC